MRDEKKVQFVYSIETTRVYMPHGVQDKETGKLQIFNVGLTLSLGSFWRNIMTYASISRRLFRTKILLLWRRARLNGNRKMK
jgi:hypothetical protein